MTITRRLQSCIIATFATLFAIASIHYLASNTTIRITESLFNNSTGIFGNNGSLGFFNSQRPWWTTESENLSFAYVQYSTNRAYFCNALINANLLQRYGATADIVILHPEQWTKAASDSTQAKMLKYAAEKFPKVKFKGVDILSTAKGDSTWQNSLTKFNAFRLTEYSRVLYFDSDSLVLNNMDHYFLAPMARLAVPRAYWLGDGSQSLAEQTICSHIMLLEPDTRYYDIIMEEARKSEDFDMEIINHLFNNSAMILPHRRLALLTGEFRSKTHEKYMSGEPDSEWNAMGEVSRAVMVHFSDWPLPKPWLPRTDAQWNAALPECDPSDKGAPDRPPCADRMMWSGFYRDYDMYKEKLCDGKF